MVLKAWSGAAPDRIVIDGVVWYHAKTAARHCGYKDHKKAIKRHVPELSVKPFGDLLGVLQTWSNQNLASSYFINEIGLMALVSRSRLRQSLVYAKRMGIETFKFKTEAAELATIDYIMTAFEGEDMSEQFPVGKYRIDLYLPRYKIAVECDEHGHKDRSTDRECERELFITEQLGCQWIRFDPHAEDFSIAKVVNVIFKAIKYKL